MFTYTQHDLSGGEVTIDWQALQRTALIAIGKCREEINHELRNFYTFGSDVKPSDMAYASERLVDLTKQLAIASETYHALTAGITSERPELKVVNR